MCCRCLLTVNIYFEKLRLNTLEASELLLFKCTTFKGLYVCLAIVRSACKSPDPIEFGFGTSNNTGDSSQFPIWTVVTFHCMAGYKLVGDSQQQCMPDGTWFEKFMPECQGREHGKLFYSR